MDCNTWDHDADDEKGLNFGGYYLIVNDKSNHNNHEPHLKNTLHVVNAEEKAQSWWRFGVFGSSVVFCRCWGQGKQAQASG